MATSKDVHRLTISNDEVFALVNLMDTARGSIGLDPTLSEFYIKVDRKAYDIGKGHAKPAYVATGIRKVSANATTVDALGATPKEKEFAHMTEDEQFAELDRLNAAMLAELVSEGSAGSENIISQERRAAERIEQDNLRDEHSTDNDTIHTALMSSTAGTVSEQDL